jgi:hypothetical protein
VTDPERQEEASELTYLRLGPELGRKLAESGVSLRDLAQRANIPGLEVGSDPATPADVKAEPITILLGTAAVIAAATPVLTRLIEAMGFHGSIVKEKKLAAVLDGNGNVIKDKDGNPIVAWEDEYKALEPKRTGSTQKATKIIGPGIEIKTRDERKP